MRETGFRAPANEQDAHISLRDLAAPLFRCKRLLIITFLSIFVAAAVLGLLQLDKYESHIVILVSRERMDPLVTTQSTDQMLVTTPPLTDEEVNSEAELLTSRDVLEQVVLANGLQHPHGMSSYLDFFHPKQTEADRVTRAVRRLADQLKVQTPTKTNLIEVTYGSLDPARAYGVLNSLGNLYLEKHAAVHRPRGSYQFFAQEAQKYKEALEASEARLSAFGQTQKVADPDDERTDLALQLTASIGQLHTTEQAIAADEQHLRSDQEQMKVTPQRSATKQDKNTPDLLLENLGTSLLAAQTKRTQLLLRYEPSYPLVREADQEIAEAKAAIAEAEKTPYLNEETDRDPTFELLREDLSKTEADLASQRASLAANQRGIDSMQAEMVKLGNQSLKLADLQREAKANEQNYLLYLSKREQERTSDALDRTRIENIAIAVPPAIPALPAHGPLFTLACAFGLAVILSLATAYTVDYLDPSFHSPAQVVDILGIPVVVPRQAMSRSFDLMQQISKGYESPPSQTSELTFAGFEKNGYDGGQSADEEALRLVQRLFLLQTAETPRVVVFAGIDHGNGCSQICASVAETLARNTPESVCLLEANFRSSALPAFFGTTNHYGFADALLREGPIRSFGKQVSRDNLWLISSGSLAADSPNPVGLGGLKNRIAELRSEFDFVIIDAPPLTRYADAISLGRLTDGLVLVLEANSTRREAAVAAAESLRSCQIKILGAVLDKRTFPIPESIYSRL